MYPGIIGAPMDLSTLTPGQTLVDQELTLSAEASAAYRGAVADANSFYDERRFVPPVALAALAFAAVMDAVKLPAGAVHARTGAGVLIGRRAGRIAVAHGQRRRQRRARRQPATRAAIPGDE